MVSTPLRQPRGQQLCGRSPIDFSVATSHFPSAAAGVRSSVCKWVSCCILHCFLHCFHHFSPKFPGSLQKRATHTEVAPQNLAKPNSPMFPTPTPEPRFPEPDATNKDLQIKGLSGISCLFSHPNAMLNLFVTQKLDFLTHPACEQHAICFPTQRWKSFQVKCQLRCMCVTDSPWTFGDQETRTHRCFTHEH